MSTEQLLESFGRLVTKLDFGQGNTSYCKELKRKYRPIIASDNTSRKESSANAIRVIIERLYKIYKSDIILKDFGFIDETKKDTDGQYILDDNSFVIDNVDIGKMYMNALDTDDEEGLRFVNNELLFLFYQVAPNEDQREIDKKHKKSPPKTQAPPNPLAAVQAQPDLAKRMESMLMKNKNKLKRAEKDPNAIPEVLADFFQNNSKDMAGMLTGMLGSMGIDPSKMDGDSQDN
jgi:hypothetical protein